MQAPRLRLAPRRASGKSRRMSRTTLAVPLGLFGFLLYLGAAAALADHVIGRHWALQALYYLVAGTVWVVPARALLLWAGRAEERPRPQR